MPDELDYGCEVPPREQGRAEVGPGFVGGVVMYSEPTPDGGRRHVLEHVDSAGVVRRLREEVLPPAEPDTPHVVDAG